jgi:hypothetical protein
MNHVSPLVAGFCLVLSACSGVSNTSDGAMPPSAGFAGSDGAISSGGDSLGGASAGQGGGMSAAMGGMVDSVGLGGTSDSGGAAATVGEGGAGLSGSGGATGGSGGAGGKAGGSPMPIDYSIWELQLPTGSGTSPTTISSSKLLAGYSDAYFYPGTDGGQMFMDPPTGVTTSGSTRCRTEMRESTVAGGEAAWPSTGTNTMTVTGKVVKGSSVTVAQVFDGGGGNTLCELQFNGKGFALFYEETKGSGSSVPLNAPVALNTKYSFTLSLSNGVLAVTINDKQVYMHTPGASTRASKFYFKVGNYDQGTSAGPVSTAVHSIVENYTVEVVHN